jgi:hypothetical protein
MLPITPRGPRIAGEKDGDFGDVGVTAERRVPALPTVATVAPPVARRVLAKGSDARESILKSGI